MFSKANYVHLNRASVKTKCLRSNSNSETLGLVDLGRVRGESEVPLVTSQVNNSSKEFLKQITESI